MQTQEFTELSPAQKAWATRKARDQYRANAEAAKAPVVTASPLAGAKIVTINLPESKIGCGYRTFVVIEIGTKWVTLFYQPTLQNIRIARLDFDRRARPEPGATPRRTARLIRKKIEQWQLLNPEDCELAVKRGRAALRALRTQS